MAGQKIQILDKSNFPTNAFFNHLRRGTEHYQEHNFERATEEWGAAGRAYYNKPVSLKRVDGKVSCGIQLDQLPFLFFLYAIYSNKLDGIGVVKNKEVAKKIVFNQGKIVRAGTTKAEERIGQFILRKRNFSEDNLSKLAEEAKHEGKRLGQYLVEKEYLTEKELREVLSLQAEEILSEALFWKEGYFYIIEGPVRKETGISFTPLQFAMVLALRGFNFSDFRNRIPSNKTIFRHSPYTDEKREEVLKTLNLNYQFIFSLIDGTRNINQLIQFSGWDEITVINILYRLSAMGLVRRTKEVVEYEDQEYIEVSKIIEVLFDVYRMITEEIFKELGIRGEKAIQDALAKLETNYQQFFVGMNLDDPDNLDSKQLFRNIASYYPIPEQRPMFIDAFKSIYNLILDEFRKFLGIGLRTNTVDAIRKKITDIERFARDSAMKERLLGVLNSIQ